jgi:hypothetical protein
VTVVRAWPIADGGSTPSSAALPAYNRGFRMLAGHDRRTARHLEIPDG